MSAKPSAVNDSSTDRPFSNVEPLVAGEQDPSLENLAADEDWELVIHGELHEQHTCMENLAADLTDVAYQVALRHGVGDKWLELQLDLWGELTEAIEKRFHLNPMKRA